MKLVQVTVLVACLCAASAGWLPEKLVKKYAMKKVYEDCFGDEVISSLKEEMHAAHIKCSGHHSEELPAADALLGDDSELSRRRRDARHFSPDKLQKLRTKITSFVGNATCILKELKMVDQENNVDLNSIKERLAKMQIDDALKKDLDESADQCHQFATCLPDSVASRSAFMMGYARQMLFFKCLKEAKLEACMKKSFREDYLPMLVEDNLPVDEDESFYTLISGAIIGEKKGY